MTISKTVCVAILFLFLAAPSWAQDKAKKNAPNKPGVQNPAGKKRQPGADAKKGENPVGDKAARANPMAGMLEKLNLSDDQSAEIRAIMKEQASERRARMENQKGNNQDRPQPGNRPKDQMVQVQAELIKKIREVLTEEQQKMFDVSLQKRAENQKANRQPGNSGNDKAKRPGNPPGKGGR